MRKTDENTESGTTCLANHSIRWLVFIVNFSGLFIFHRNSFDFDMRIKSDGYQFDVYIGIYITVKFPIRQIEK